MKRSGKIGAEKRCHTCTGVDGGGARTPGSWVRGKARKVLRPQDSNIIIVIIIIIVVGGIVIIIIAVIVVSVVHILY